MRSEDAITEDERSTAEPADIDELSDWVRSRVRVEPDVLAPAVSTLRECVLAWEGYRLQIATFLGVTVNESAALSYLVARGDMPMSELAALLGFGSGSATLLVDRLEAKGLVQRQPDPGDRRRTIVRASSTSHRHLALIAQWPALVFADLDEDEVTRVREVLALVGGRLRGFAGLVEGAQAPVERPRRRQ